MRLNDELYEMWERNAKYTNTPIESKYKITSTGEIKRTTTYD